MSTSNIQERIALQIQEHPVILYMKGCPRFPQCGFSQQAAALLRSHSVDFHSVNVLEDNDLRAGIKVFSDWPTIPQLYINNEFIGGYDIMLSMESSGDLAKKLQPFRIEQSETH